MHNENETLTGTIKFFRKDRGFGFIKATSGEDYFFHISNVSPYLNAENGLEDKAKVTFKITSNTRKEGSMKAIDVDLVTE